MSYNYEDVYEPSELEIEEMLLEKYLDQYTEVPEDPEPISLEEMIQLDQESSANLSNCDAPWTEFDEWIDSYFDDCVRRGILPEESIG